MASGSWDDDDDVPLAAFIKVSVLFCSAPWAAPSSGHASAKEYRALAKETLWRTQHIFGATISQRISILWIYCFPYLTFHVCV